MADLTRTCAVLVTLKVLTVVSYLSEILFVAEHVLDGINSLQAPGRYGLLVMMPADRVHVYVRERVGSVERVVVQSLPTVLIHLQVHDQGGEEFARDAHPHLQEDRLERELHLVDLELLEEQLVQVALHRPEDAHLSLRDALPELHLVVVEPRLQHARVVHCGLEGVIVLVEEASVDLTVGRKLAAGD